MRTKNRLKALSALVLAPGVAQAADFPLPTIKGPPPAIASSPWEVQFGARYWFSSGNHQFDLYDPFIASQKNSRLTYSKLDAHSAETFFRVDHASGVFLKGFAGGGAIVSGKLNDEDFPGVGVPIIYSNTISTQSGGALAYASVDLGYNAFGGAAWRIGPFVGYHHMHERMNTFGCAQVGPNPGVRGDVPPVLTPIPAAFDALDLDASWNTLRAGVAGEVVVLPGLKVALEAAWAHNWLSAYDYHNFRTNIRPLPQDGQGDGFQIEGVVTYDLTPRISVGVGGRYWKFDAVGRNHWERAPGGAFAGVPAAPLATNSERYGAFLQASYRFGGPKDPTGAGVLGPMFGKAEAEPHDWTGFHAGVNVGYGFGKTSVTALTPASVTAVQFYRAGALPAAQASEVAGFLGGGQIGFNYQFGGWFVVGLESDAQYARIAGSYADTDINFGFTTGTRRMLEWLGTTRAKAGALVRDDILLYGTGGFAYGGVSTRGAVQGLVGLSCAFTFCSAGAASFLATGWVAGAGVEYAVSRDLSFKMEWLYVDLGRQTYGINDHSAGLAFGVPLNLRAASDSATHIVRTGLNYRFDWRAMRPAKPLIAKY